MPDEKKKGIETGDVKSKGYWQSPQQIYKALSAQWAKLEKEDLDLEGFRKEKKITYFNTPFSIDLRTDYDRRFNVPSDFDPKKPREDRQNMTTIWNNIFEQERKKTLPTSTSRIYGFRKTNLEGKPWLPQKRVSLMREMYRRNKVNLKPIKKLPQSPGLDKL